MKIDFQKFTDGLVPAIVQDARTQRVLMLGFMNAESFAMTEATRKAAFYSRSRQRIWVKGETSGNFLRVETILLDCDSDTILIKADPAGPACHTGSDTCFGETNEADNFLFKLENIISDRKMNPSPGAYTSKLFEKGVNAVAQKVGEEAVELIIAAKDPDTNAFKNEAADLLYHFLVLLNERAVLLSDVVAVLQNRSR